MNNFPIYKCNRWWWWRCIIYKYFSNTNLLWLVFSWIRWFIKIRPRIIYQEKWWKSLKQSEFLQSALSLLSRISLCIIHYSGTLLIWLFLCDICGGKIVKIKDAVRNVRYLDARTIPSSCVIIIIFFSSRYKSPSVTKFKLAHVWRRRDGKTGALARNVCSTSICKTGKKHLFFYHITNPEGKD